MATNYSVKNAENTNLIESINRSRGTTESEKFEKSTVSDAGTFINSYADSLQGMIRLYPVPEVNPSRWFVLATITLLNLSNSMVSFSTYYLYSLTCSKLIIYESDL